MTVPEAIERTVLVSDLHMATDVDERHGRADRRDDFRADGAFVGFLEHIRRCAQKDGARTRLVLLGDLLDFVRVPVDGGERLDDRACAARRIERIATSHRAVFLALGRGC